MAVYTYEAIDRMGQTVTGKVEAEQDWEAAERLRKMGLTVLDVSEVKASVFSNISRPRARVGLADVSLFSRELAATLDAGIPLTRSLFTLSRQAGNPSLREVIGGVARDVEAGAGFADSLKAHPEVFSPFYVSMIRVGEVSGSLNEVLQDLAEQLERSKFLRDQVRAATFYPVVVLSFAVLVVLAMMIFVVPVFLKFFPPGVQLPLPTRVVIGISDALRNWWYLWLLVMAAGIWGVRAYLGTPSGNRVWDRLKLRLPVFGRLFQLVTVARFCRTLAGLLAGGIPLLQALETAGPAAGNLMVEEALKQAAAKIQEGKSIAQPLEESGLFPPLVIQMVATGEETGSLPELLKRLAGFYETEVEALTKGLSSLIEPVLIIAVGALVGFMVISMYMPIFTAVTSFSR